MPALNCRSGVAFVFLLGFIYVGYLLTLPQEGVFYSGDGGLKYLMIKSHLAPYSAGSRHDERVARNPSGASEKFLPGVVSPVLKLPVSLEIRSLWQEGFYPFGPPYVYNVDQQPDARGSARGQVAPARASLDGAQLFGLPIYFALLTIPFYVLLGWRGLYVLPALGVILSWLLLVWAGRRSGFREATVSLILAVFIFASPVTLYAGMFWEHSLGVAFACLPLLFIVEVFSGKLSAGKAALLGGMAGLGVFFRPEMLTLLAGTLVIVPFFLSRFQQRMVLAFALGVVSAVFVFLKTNLILDGNLLGLHAQQIFEQDILSWSRGWTVIDMTVVVNKHFAIFCPFILPVVLGIGYIRRCPLNIQRAAVSSLLIFLFCVILIPWLLPDTGGKEWGPRYLLILIPWVVFPLGAAFEGWRLARREGNKLSWVIFLIISLLAGFYLHSRVGVGLLAQDYRERVFPAYRWLRREPSQFVLVSHQWIALELAALTGDKNFLWVKSSAEFARAEKALASKGICDFLYVTYPNGRFRFLPVDETGLLKVGNLGSYDVYKVSQPSCHSEK